LSKKKVIYCSYFYSSMVPMKQAH